MNLQLELLEEKTSKDSMETVYVDGSESIGQNISNEEMMPRVDQKIYLITPIKTRQTLIYHVKRGDSVSREIIEGQMEEQRA